MTNNIQLYNADCLDILPQLTGIDMILCDPPYGITNCNWDTVIPFAPMWQNIKAITNKNAAIVFTASQPFTSNLIMSNIKHFKQEVIWNKKKGSNPLLAKKRIMQAHENIIIFCYGSLPYNPQMRPGKPYKAPRTGGNRTNKITGGKDKKGFKQKDNDGFRYPISVLEYSIHYGSKKHPSQKPLVLMEYLIKTYTNEGDTVLDFAMGSGTTGVAAINTNRKFIGIEIDKKYFDISVERTNEQKDNNNG